jgi:DivIVA domain-containing protein
MSILDMDVTPRRHAGHIRSREFATIRKGYDQDQVRQFLDQVAGWFDDMETDLAEARAAAAAKQRAEASAPTAAPAGGIGPDDPYAAMGARVADVLRHAEEHARTVREEAEQEAQRTLEEARRESISLRHRAQEDAEAARQSAQEQAEATRRAAQEEADLVRSEAAVALETARVEAERTVAGLSERRNVLAAELQATRSRLMGIVSQLEEEHEALPAEEESGGLGRSWADAPSSPGSIASDDPRRDPLPPDLPAFAPPPLPSRPSTAGASNGMGDTSGHQDTEVFEPSESSPPEIVAHGVEDPPKPMLEDTAVPALAEPPEPDPAPALEIEPDQRLPELDDAGLLMWGPSEAGQPSPDMSLPDFPWIDIPGLEEEGPVE